jgi:hypothetical protein
LFQVDADEGSSQHNERQLGENKHLMDIRRKIKVGLAKVETTMATIREVC